jgi:predicted dehydrogenase
LTQDVRDLFVDAALEAVVVATPVISHTSIAMAAVEAGKSVFVEKPLAATVADAERMVALAAVKDVVLMVGHTFLYNGAVRRVKQIIDAGELGELRYVFCQRLNLGVVRSDVDALWNLAPHDLSILNYWIGRPITDAVAVGHSFLQPGIADVVFAHLTYEGNISGHIQVSWLNPEKVRRSTVVGSKRMLVYDDVSQDSPITIYDKGIDVGNLDQNMGEFDSYASHQLIARAGDVWLPRVEFPEPLAVEVKEFADSIRDHRRPLTDGASGVDVVRILERLSASMSA